MEREWYKLKITYPKNADPQIKQKTETLLREKLIENKSCVIGEDFESEEWSNWLTLDQDMPTISKLLPDILIGVEIETEGTNEDKCYTKHYFQKGETVSVIGTITYPTVGSNLWPNARKDYIENIINQEISEYIGERTDNDLIDCVRDAAAKIESICNYAIQFGDISTDESAALRKPFYDAFNDLFVD